VDFGRAGTTYYKVYDRIDVANLSSPQISILTSEAKLLIMRVAAHSLSILHRERIVHGDLKPANILIKKSETGAYTSKLIDFDDSYFDGEPPDDAELVIGDPAYYSPELLRYVITNDNTLRGKISTKSDIFALGLIFAEYWTGKMPTYKTSRFGSCAAAVWGGEDLQFDASTMRKEVSTLIRSMIQLDPNNRPSAPEVLSHL
jgi:serine/threonine protein kinase